MNDNNILELRAHHLLCTVLYKGSGYSEGFVSNMNEVTNSLKDGCLVRIINKPDHICSYCPNRCKDGSCALDNEKQDKSDKDIRSLDDLVIDYFDINEDKVYDSRELYRIVSDSIEEAFFDSSCGNCRWLKEGLCSFDEYRNRIHIFSGK